MITVNIRKTTNYSTIQQEKLKSATEVMVRVINSDQFKDAVTNFETDGEKTFSFKRDFFRSFDSYTNSEVYQMIMQAREEVANVADGSIDLYLELLPGGDGQNIGYGNADEIIYTYQDFFDNATVPAIANHLTHEWCHKIGFRHAKLRWMDSNRDCCSVPYAIGNLVEKMA